MTDETTLVTAQPDGTFEAKLSSEPARVQDEGGSWKALNPELSVVGGHLEPEAALHDVRVSDGGPAGSVIASIDQGDASYAVKSPWALPKPTLDGALATYSEVLPGVDLVVEVTNTGFSHNWVVKNAEAAADPRVRSLTLETETAGLTPTVSQGSVVYTGTDGPAAFTPAPLVWDSSGSGEDDTSASAVQDGPSLSDAVQRVGLSATDNSLTLKTPATILDDPETQFPVVIDPYYVPYTPGRSSWAAVWSIYPNQPFFNTSHSLGAGYEGFEQNKKVRSFFQFKTSAVASKNILSASMNVPQVHAAACGSYPTKVYQSGGIGSGTTWNNQPKQYGYQDSNSSDVGCGHSSDTGNMSWSVLSGMKNVASARSGTATFEVTGPEGDRNGWKQFVNDGVNLSIKFIGDPRPPTGFQFGRGGNLKSTCASSPSTAPAFNGVTRSDGTLPMTFAAHPQSTDSSSSSESTNLRTLFRVHDENANTDQEILTDSNVQSNAYTSVAWPATSPVKFVNGGLYRTWTRTESKWNITGNSNDFHYLDSSYTGPCYFKVDTVSPQAPVITTTDGQLICDAPVPADQPSGDPVAPACVSPQPYFKDSFTVKASPAAGAERAKKYQVKVDGVLLPTVVAAADGTALLTITASSSFPEIEVTALDAATNASSGTTFKVQSRNPSATARWQLNEAPGSTTGSNSVSGGTALAVPSANTLGAKGRLGSALRLAGTAPAVSGAGLVDTTHDFSIVAWANVSASTAHGTLFSVAGARGSAIELDYNDQRWSMRRTASDAPNAVREQMTADASSPSNAWSSMAVTFDAESKTLWLYENGQLIEKSTLSTAGWVSTGAVWLGCRRSEGAVDNCLDASIDDVQVFDARVTSDGLKALSNPTVDSIPDVLQVGAWTASGAAAAGPIAEAAGGSALALTGGASVGLSDSSDGGQVLKLPGGSSQAATTPTIPVIDSSGSFTLAVKVRLSDLTANGVIVRGTDPSGTDAWALRYASTGAQDSGGNDIGRWRFVRSASANDPTFEAVQTPGPDTTGSLFTLVVVYDSNAQKAQLFVNPSYTDSDSASPKTNFSAPPWANINRIVVGNGTMSTTAAPLKGEVASMDLWVGAMTANQVNTKYAPMESDS